MHSLNDYRDIWVFAEIQDHERILDASLEILSRGRELSLKLGQKLIAVLPGLDSEQYLPVIKEYSPDIIYYFSHPGLKHYHSEIFPCIFTNLINKYNPSIMLFPSSEAGKDLAPRLAQRFATGLTSHCTDLDIVDIEGRGKGLLLMKRPGFSGNFLASMICPDARPQMATVQPGVFEKKPVAVHGNCTIIKLELPRDASHSCVSHLEPPLRWDSPRVPLEQAEVIIGGGRGVGSAESFNSLFELAELLGGEVGATRVPVFNEWCGEERMIGQTGKTVRPRLYLNFGVSGQLQHTASIVESGIIISVNTDPEAPINEISDYVIQEDAGSLLHKLIEKLKLIKLMSR